MLRPVALLLSALVIPASELAAQAGDSIPLELGYTVRLESRVLGVPRTLSVTLPAGYASNPDARYPVVFVLDGDWEHVIAAAVSRFYATTSQTPPLIVVGIHTQDRMRVLTPPAVAGWQPPPEATEAGDAERFLEFLEHELVPWVDRSYRTAPMRVLAGHSLGGLFALHALGQRPGLFTGWLVMEPSAWWNEGHALQRAVEVLRGPSGRHERLVTVNTQRLGLDTTSWGGGAPMVRELSVQGETHGSMALAGMMAGLRTIFADFRPAEWRPGTRPIAMLARYDSLEARVGYPVPIPQRTFELVFRMSLNSRHFDDAELVVTRMERELGASASTGELRQRLATERATPAPAEFVPLEFPARRPTPQQARAFLGRWESMTEPRDRQLEVRASGDTIIVHDRIRLRGDDWFDADDPVIQVTADGTLEWGLPWFRGLAALVVLKGRIQQDGTMLVTREARGWVPRGPGGDMTRTERLRRVSP